MAAAPAGFSHSIAGCPSAGTRRSSRFLRTPPTYFLPSRSRGRYFGLGGPSRRSGGTATEQASCPPGTTANGTHTGPRCWNAYTNADLYFPASYTLTSTDCAAAPVDVDAVRNEGASRL